MSVVSSPKCSLLLANTSNALVVKIAVLFGTDRLLEKYDQMRDEGISAYFIIEAIRVNLQNYIILTFVFPSSLSIKQLPFSPVFLLVLLYILLAWEVPNTDVFAIASSWHPRYFYSPGECCV